MPVAGDEFNVVEDEKAAKEVAEHRAEKARQKELGSVKKADARGPLREGEDHGRQGPERRREGRRPGLLRGREPGPREGGDEEGRREDPRLGRGRHHRGATSSPPRPATAIIVGFNTRPETKVEQIASQQGVKILLFDIIYEAVDKIREEMAGLLDPIIKEKPLGKAEVRAVFNIPKIGAIAGSAVTEGVVKRGALVRVLRDRKVVHTGKICSLKRLKDDVREVATGFECGIGVEGFSDVKPGDVLEAYELEEIRPSLD